MNQPSLRYGSTYEESSADGVNPRPHWAHLMQSLERLGSEELDHRWARAERRIRENGITYNIYGDPQGVNRPWKTDVVPLLIPAEEWRFLEAGVVQRAELMSCLLRDLYGPQRLLHEGHFPAALLYGNPAFLRPMVGVVVPEHSYLHMIAVDLARSPDGQWWVLADRTQAPSGSGYALENRTIVADLLPELFSESNVLRLAPFFRAQREALASMTDVANPRIVLLTPGPHNETYFEQSYLTVRDRTCTSKPSTASNRSTSSCAAWTTASAIRSSCAATPCSAFPDSWTRWSRATSAWPTHSAAA